MKPRCCHCGRPMMVLSLKAGGWRWKHEGGWPKKNCKQPETTMFDNEEMLFVGQPPKKPWRAPK